MIFIAKQRIVTCEEWHNIFEYLGQIERLQCAQTISVKPNLAAGTYADPNTHIMTDPTLLASLINYISLINSNATIYIAESDSTGYGFAFLKFEHLNLPHVLALNEQACSQVKMLDLTRDKLIPVNNNAFRFFNTIDKQLWLSETFMNSEIRISLSNLKTHSVTGYTGACKNLFGCLPETNKSVYHPIIHKVIHDLTVAISPNINIVDAFYGMEQNGPVQGFDVASGFRVIADSALEADMYAGEVAGLRPSSIKYLKYLMLTIGIQYEPVDKDSYVTPYKKPQNFLRIMNSIGLLIQGIGLSIADFGHRIHTCFNPLTLIITVSRPVLLKLFDYDKLKAIKRKIMND